MFGISLVELLTVLILAIFLVKPSDLPQIARFLGKTYSKFKKIANLIKKNIDSTKKEIGFDQIKQEFNLAIDEELSEDGENDKKSSQIVDIYGKTHHVMDVSDIRPDLSKEEIQQEIDSLNQQNQKKTLNQENAKKDLA